MTDNGWMPIETAVKDGTTILLYVPGIGFSGLVSTGRWEPDKYNDRPRPYWRVDWMRQVTMMRDMPPTHWQPLPSPPEATP